MSSLTFLTATSRHSRPTTGVLARVRTGVVAHRDAARARRDLDAILAGHHGRTMRDEIASVMSRG
jgi:hypothetical protein